MLFFQVYTDAKTIRSDLLQSCYLPSVIGRKSVYFVIENRGQHSQAGLSVDGKGMIP